MKTRLALALALSLVFFGSAPLRAVIGSNLIACYPLDDDPTWDDAGPSDYDLTEGNTVDAGGALGAYSASADFEEGDANDRLTRADNADLSMGAEVAWTLTAWVKGEAIVSLGGIALKGDGTNGEYLLYYNSGTDRYEVKVWGGLAFANECNAIANTFGSPPDGAAHFLVVQHDPVANTLAISVNNGTPDSVSCTTGVVDSGGAFQVGSYQAFGWDWDGLIGSVVLWKSVLSAGDITALYNAGSGVTCATIQAATAFRSLPLLGVGN